jgi:hypothetical protein
MVAYMAGLGLTPAAFVHRAQLLVHVDGPLVFGKDAQVDTGDR